MEKDLAAAKVEIENQVVELQEAAAEKKHLVEKREAAETENIKLQINTIKSCWAYKAKS